MTVNMTKAIEILKCTECGETKSYDGFGTSFSCGACRSVDSCETVLVCGQCTEREVKDENDTCTECQMGAAEARAER